MSNPKPNPVGWFEIYVNDMARAKKFYEAVFQTNLTSLSDPSANEMPTEEMWAFQADYNNYGASGTLVKMEGFKGGIPSSTLVYFSCNDCSIEEKRAQENGGKVEKSKFSIGQYGFIS